jgi:hypothetical protein
MMNVVSVAIDATARYMPGGLGPTESYAEDPFGSEPRGSNVCYSLVRTALAGAGLDAARLGSPEWNPLGEWVRSDDRVFVLPNFVAHRREGESMDDFHAKCTHASVLRPIIDYAFIANGDASRISVGNAPLQGCDYERVAEQTRMTELAAFYRERTGASLGPVDLRQLHSTWTRFGALLESRTVDEPAVHFDLGEDSYLDPLFAHGQAQVRVGDYPPADTMSYHAPGRHVYVLNRRVLEADVIISVPKLKTHQKVGITCALKGTVGAIARKECLAHHRLGGPSDGGDEYPATSTVRRLYSRLTDHADASGTSPADNTVRIAAKLLGRAVASGEGIRGGAWYGNDTAWRMVLDIARILLYGRTDGTMASTPQRRHIAFVDGVTAGEGEGPLRPSARHAGVVIFGSDPVRTDDVCARIMGFEPDALAMIREARALPKWPLVTMAPDALSVTDAGTGHAMDELPALDFRPAKGWVGHMRKAV